SQISNKRARYSHPQVGIDGKGRVWLTYLERGGARGSTKLGTFWVTVARRLDGDKWTDPIEIHNSDGMMDPRPVLLPHAAGALRIIHNADGRYSRPAHIENQIFMSYLDLPGDPVEPKLEPFEAGAKDEKAIAKNKAERENLERIRGYRVENGG